MTIAKPGIYDIPAERYHSDPVEVPSLSCSIAKKLARQSPMHAHHCHPRLGGSGDVKPTAAMIDGTILHTLLLGKGADIVPIEADNFMGKAAKAARDEALAAGKTPILAHKLEALHEAARVARKQIEEHEDGRLLFAPGKPEQVMVWQEGETWFRSMVDWKLDDLSMPLVDLKGTGLSGAPEDWQRRLIEEYAFQDAFYARGFKAIHGITPPPMMFVVVEFDAPFGVSVMSPAPSLRHIASAEVDRAITVWRHCMETNHWPGYPKKTVYVEAPIWALKRHEEREFMAEQTIEHHTTTQK